MGPDLSPDIPETKGAVPRIVILGGGFAGLEAAKAMRRLPAEITLIDQQNHHCFQPLLYQVATAGLSPADVAWPIRHVLRRQGNVVVLMATVTGIDRDARLVRTDSVEVPFDFLVVATGAAHSYFGHEEWEPAAPGLKRIEDATRIRRRFLMAFERAEIAGDREREKPLLTFVIVGGGPTGVEMAGAVAEVARRTLPREFRRIDPGVARIVLVEAGARILPTLPEPLSRYAAQTLADMGVEVLTGRPVTHCDEHGVTLGDERIDAATVIWAAGVVASPAAAWLDAERDRAGRVIVEPDLSLPGFPHIFVIGDTASVAGPNGPVPGLAPAAKQMGRYVAGVIGAELGGRARPAAFRYRHLGDLAVIGRRAAVVRLSRLTLTGFVGWLFWSLAHIYFLIGARNRAIVAFDWFWQYLTFQRGARLIVNAEPGPRPVGRSEPKIDD